MKPLNKKDLEKVHGGISIYEAFINTADMTIYNNIIVASALANCKLDEQERLLRGFKDIKKITSEQHFTTMDYYLKTIT